MKKVKESSLLRQWLDIQHERAMTKKAWRLATKQEWSVEFLTMLAIRAANHSKRPYELEIRNKSGHAIIIRTTDDNRTQYNDESIFNHLDNDLKVRQFIETVNRK